MIVLSINYTWTDSITMDFNRLRTFIVVAETGNMTRAAEKLYRTQPAITQQMKLLQEELNLVLFERRKARIFLTSQGKRLYEYAKPRVLELEDIPQRLRKDHENATGIIKLGATQETAPLFGPQLIKAFTKQYPNIGFELYVDSVSNLEHGLMACDLDFYIDLYARRSDQLESQFIGQLYRLPVATPSYLENHGQPHHFRELTSLDIIAFKDQSFDWLPWIQEIAPELETVWAGFNAKVVVDDFLCYQTLILNGTGIGMGFLPHMQNALNEEKLRPVFPRILPLGFNCFMTRRKVRNFQMAADLFSNFIKSQLNKKPLLS